MTTMTIVEKFRGCLLGGLIGDCFGAPFELRYRTVSKPALSDFIEKKLSYDSSKGGDQMIYTDDTEMARSVAESLIVKNGFDGEDMARRFTEEYFGPLQAQRGYGSFVPHVFVMLKEKGYTNVFEPAKAQFDGEGSFGNGAAMRTHPVALFCYDKDQETLLDVCRKVAKLTHAHLDGYNGAILQTLAIRQALNADPNQKIDSMEFLQQLEIVMKELEKGKPLEDSKIPSFCTQIENIRHCLKNTDMDPIDVGEALGNDETAVFSLPSAIYCFLRSQEPISYYETTNPFLRCLFLSIAVGGDTDTIACMACSLAGSFYGTSCIPQVLYEQCEASALIMQQADRLAKLVGVL